MPEYFISAFIFCLIYSMKREWCLLLLLILLFASCRTQRLTKYSDRNKLYTPAELKQDVDFAFNVLKERHPDVYMYISQRELNNKIDSIKNLITEPMTARKFYTLIAPVYHSIACIHSTVSMPQYKFTKAQKDSLKQADENRAITQLQFLYQDEKLFVIGTKNKKVEAVKGVELLHIQEHNVSDLLKIFLKHSPRDGYNITFPELFVSDNFLQLYHLYYELKDTMQLQFSCRDSVFTKYYSKINKEDSLNVTTSNTKNAKSEKVKKKKEKVARDPYPYRGKDDKGNYILDFKFLDSLYKTAYMKISSFSTIKSNFNKFYRIAFDSLQNQNAENLIIDLRGNKGGFIFRPIKLYRYLTDTSFIFIRPALSAGKHNPATYSKGATGFLQRITNGIVLLFAIKKDDKGQSYRKIYGTEPVKPYKNNYRNKIYVLTDGFTASAAALLAANLKGNDRVELVGEETGGGANVCFAGQYTKAATPNTNLHFRVGMYAIAPIVQQPVQGRGVLPDERIKRTVADVINKKNPALDRLIEQLLPEKCELKQ